MEPDDYFVISSWVTGGEMVQDRAMQAEFCGIYLELLCSFPSPTFKRRLFSIISDPNSRKVNGRHIIRLVREGQTDLVCILPRASAG